MDERMKKYLPLRIQSRVFGRGWWWGTHCWFFRRFAIVPMWWHYKDCLTLEGKPIVPKHAYSWDEYDRINGDDLINL